MFTLSCVKLVRLGATCKVLQHSGVTEAGDVVGQKRGGELGSGQCERAHNTKILTFVSGACEGLNILLSPNPPSW